VAGRQCSFALRSAAMTQAYKLTAACSEPTVYATAKRVDRARPAAPSVLRSARLLWQRAQPEEHDSALVRLTKPFHIQGVKIGR
jgi:hypothetical protein